MHYEILNNYIKILKKRTPGFNVKYKDQSLFMKILGKIMFFNKSFMTTYTTTIGKTVYFPNEEKVKNTVSYMYISTLAHEYKHVKDYKKYNILFMLSYLFPQILAIISFILMIAAIWISWIMFAICLALTIALVLPIPSPGRKHWEIRGYIVSLYFANEIHKKRWGDENIEVRKEILRTAADRYNDKFISGDYYYMWPSGVKQELYTAIEDIMSGEMERNDPFMKELSEDLKNSGI